MCHNTCERKKKDEWVCVCVWKVCLSRCTLTSYLFIKSNEQTFQGELDCLAWSKCKENVLAVSSNNDIRLYDIRVRNFAFIVYSYSPKQAEHIAVYV